MRLVVLGLAAVLPGLCVIAFTEYQVHLARQAEVRLLALRSAEDAAFEVTRIVIGIQGVMQAVSRSPVVQDTRGADCNAYVSGLLPDLPELAALYITDLSGQVRCGSNAMMASAASVAGRSYFSEALQSNALVMGEYTISRRTGTAILPIALATHDGTGRQSGVLVAALDLQRLGEMLRQRGLMADGSITLADRSGTIIARQPFPERFVGTKIPDAFMYLVNAPQAGVVTVMSQDGTPRVLGYVPISKPPVGIYLSAGLSAEQSYGAVDRAARISLLIALCAALGTFAVCWVVGHRMFIRPLQRIRTVLTRWQTGNHTARTGLDGSAAEVGELGAGLDQLMDQIQDAEEHRNLLAGELAHRIKNTLATVMAIANSTMNKSGPATELLPAFTARIIALASTHEVLIRERWEHAELHDVLARVIQPLCGEADAQIRSDGPPIMLQPREALGITLVLHELCTNAIKYGALSVATGHVNVTWSVADGPRGAVLTLLWQESGGPPIKQQARPGFGTRLMGRTFGRAGSTNLDFAESGVTCRIEIELPD